MVNNFIAEAEKSRTELRDRWRGKTRQELETLRDEHEQRLQKVAEMEPNDPVFNYDFTGMAIDDLLKELG